MQPPGIKKKLFKCYLSDPQPDVPDEKPECLADMPLLGDYVLVKAKTIKPLETTKTKYTYDDEACYILTKDWQCFDEVRAHTHAHTQKYVYIYLYL